MCYIVSVVNSTYTHNSIVVRLYLKVLCVTASPILKPVVKLLIAFWFCPEYVGTVGISLS